MFPPVPPDPPPFDPAVPFPPPAPPPSEVAPPPPPDPFAPDPAAISPAVPSPYCEGLLAATCPPLNPVPVENPTFPSASSVPDIKVFPEQAEIIAPPTSPVQGFAVRVPDIVIPEYWGITLT